MSVKKTWDQLLEELERINAALPEVEELDDWIPRDIDEERGIVIAAKYTQTKILFNSFKPMGVWKKVYDLILQRKRIRREMEEIAEEEDGPAVFVPIDEEESDEENDI